MNDLKTKIRIDPTIMIPGRVLSVVLNVDGARAVLAHLDQVRDFVKKYAVIEEEA